MINNLIITILKKNTIKRFCLNTLKVSLLSLLFLSPALLKAQVSQNSILYISDNTFFYMDAAVGNYSFGTATTSLSKSTKTITPGYTYGRLIFDDTVTHSGAANTHFFDGYVTTLSSNDFIFPVGDGTGVNALYAPAKVNATTANGVDAAFYKAATSTLGTAIAATEITGVLTNNYWNIRKTSGSDANAKISLSWSSEFSLSGLVSDLNSLVILGWNSTTSKWEEVPSAADAIKFTTVSTASTITSGSITSTADVSLSNTFQFFTLGAKLSCSPILADNGVTTTWNGTAWSNGTPTELHIAVLNANYSGNLIANTLNIGAFNVTIGANQVVEVVKGITGTGKFVIAPTGALVQRQDSATAPKIELTKDTRTLSRYDYTYFASPVTENVFSQLSDAYYLTTTNNNRLYNHYKLISGDHLLFGEDLVPANPYLTPWQTLSSSNFVPAGQGWISSIQSMAPFNTDAFTGVISLKLSGTSNNGVVTAPVVTSPSIDLDHGSNYNLLGNPYPSAISASKFLMYDTNDVIDGVVYIWEAKTQPLNSGVGYYNQADYITFSRAGSTGTYVGAPNFDGNIASGQGFVVKALTDNSTVTFNNCMRLVGTTENTSFFRTTSDSHDATSTPHQSVDRFKLDLTSSIGDYNQSLIAYIPGLTYGYDRGYDATKNSNATSQIFAINNLTNKRTAIEARPSFVNTDVVPLGFSTSNNLATTTFTLNVVNREGIFENNGVTIYLYDRLNNLYHDFNNGSFSFTASQEELLNRFDIVYQTSTLSNPDFTANNVIVNLDDSVLNIASKDAMKQVGVYDIAGRLVEKISVDATQLNSKFNHAKGVYIVQIELNNGSILSNKVINK